MASIDDDWMAALVAGAPDISARVVHHLLGQVAALAPAERDILLTTLRTWLECGGNASAAARQLYCHRNTVRNRLHRLEALSGQSLSDPRGVAGLSIAAQGARLLDQDLTPPRQAPLQQPTGTPAPRTNARSNSPPGSGARSAPAASTPLTGCPASGQRDVLSSSGSPCHPHGCRGLPPAGKPQSWIPKGFDSL